MPERQEERDPTPPPAESTPSRPSARAETTVPSTTAAPSTALAPRTAARSPPGDEADSTSGPEAPNRGE